MASKRVLQEGGYEASLYSGAKLVPQVEDQIVTAVHALVDAVRPASAETPKPR